MKKSEINKVFPKIDELKNYLKDLFFSDKYIDGRISILEAQKNMASRLGYPSVYAVKKEKRMIPFVGAEVEKFTPYLEIMGNPSEKELIIIRAANKLSGLDKKTIDKFVELIPDS